MILQRSHFEIPLPLPLSVPMARLTAELAD